MSPGGALFLFTARDHERHRGYNGPPPTPRSALRCLPEVLRAAIGSVLARGLSGRALAQQGLRNLPGHRRISAGIGLRTIVSGILFGLNEAVVDAQFPLRNALGSS